MDIRFLWPLNFNSLSFSPGGRLIAFWGSSTLPEPSGFTLNDLKPFMSSSMGTSVKTAYIPASPCLQIKNAGSMSTAFMEILFLSSRATVFSP